MHLLLLVLELVHVLVFHLLTLHVFVDDLVLLTVEVNFLDLANLLVKSLDLKLVGIHLRLVVLQLANHFLKLHRSFLEVLLVNLELLSHLWTTLLGQDILQLDVELLFFLDEHVFLRDLLGLGNESLLKRLDLLDHLIGLWVSALKLSPSMHVEWLLKLIVKVFGLLLLLEILLLEQVDLTL